MNLGDVLLPKTCFSSIVVSDMMIVCRFLNLPFQSDKRHVFGDKIFAELNLMKTYKKKQSSVSIYFAHKSISFSKKPDLMPH